MQIPDAGPIFPLGDRSTHVTSSFENGSTLWQVEYGWTMIPDYHSSQNATGQD